MFGTLWSCRPFALLPADVRRVVSDSSLLFPDPPGGPAEYQGIKDADRTEFVRLVVKQIKSSKVGLRRGLRAGGGTVFGVGKKGTSKVREVWDGSRVSDVCVAPPPPPLLATPSSFSRIEVGKREQMLLSKKDCRCFFDQLALPSSIQPWTGRPPVTIAELVDFGGLTLEDVAMLLDPTTRPRRSDVVYPVSLVWCMGFAWSSYVAQSTLLAACRGAGFRLRWSFVMRTLHQLVLVRLAHLLRTT